MTRNTLQISKSYLEAALWSSTDDNDAALDANYTIDDQLTTIAESFPPVEIFAQNGEVITE